MEKAFQCDKDTPESILIDQIEKFPHLWDKKHTLYKDQVAIENAWTTISCIMEINVDECKKMWEYLRGKYIRERRILKTLPSGSGATKDVWIWYNRMGFLDPVLQTRRTKGAGFPTKSVGPIPSCSWQELIVDCDGLLSPTESQGSHEAMNVTESEPASVDDSEAPLPDTDMPSTSTSTPKGDEQTPSSLRQDRNAIKKRKLSKTSVKEPLEVLVDSCSALGNNIQAFLQNNPTDLENTMNKADFHYAISLMESLSKIKNEKKKLKLKASFLMQIADLLEDEED